MAVSSQPVSVDIAKGVAKTAVAVAIADAVAISAITVTPPSLAVT